MNKSESTTLTCLKCQHSTAVKCEATSEMKDTHDTIPIQELLLLF